MPNYGEHSIDANGLCWAWDGRQWQRNPWGDQMVPVVQWNPVPPPAEVGEAERMRQALVDAANAAEAAAPFRPQDYIGNVVLERRFNRVADNAVVQVNWGNLQAAAAVPRIRNAGGRLEMVYEEEQERYPGWKVIHDGDVVAKVGDVMCLDTTSPDGVVAMRATKEDYLAWRSDGYMVTEDYGAGRKWGDMCFIRNGLNGQQEWGSAYTKDIPITHRLNPIFSKPHPFFGRDHEED